ncbi:hypothetical protein N2152v2_007837 [Parachlorella kessleri]
MSVAVLGAGGPTGLACVQTLLEQGRSVRAVVRNPEKEANTLGALKSDWLEVVQGDVTNEESLRQALLGCSGAIFAAAGKGKQAVQDVDFEGVGNVAQAAKDLGGFQRVVLVSSGLVTPARRFHPIRIMLNSIVARGQLDAKWKGEELLRRSGVPYTIIRPGRLNNGAAGQAELVADQGDKSTGQVTRAEVAAACVAALSDPAAQNVTLELTSKAPGGGSSVPPLEEQLRTLFKGLQPDKDS